MLYLKPLVAQMCIGCPLVGSIKLFQERWVGAQVHSKTPPPWFVRRAAVRPCGNQGGGAKQTGRQISLLMKHKDVTLLHCSSKCWISKDTVGGWGNARECFVGAKQISLSMQRGRNHSFSWHIHSEVILHGYVAPKHAIIQAGERRKVGRIYNIIRGRIVRISDFQCICGSGNITLLPPHSNVKVKMWGWGEYPKDIPKGRIVFSL